MPPFPTNKATTVSCDRVLLPHHYTLDINRVQTPVHNQQKTKPQKSKQLAQVKARCKSTQHLHSLSSHTRTHTQMYIHTYPKDNLQAYIYFLVGDSPVRSNKNESSLSQHFEVAFGFVIVLFFGNLHRRRERVRFWVEQGNSEGKQEGKSEQGREGRKERRKEGEKEGRREGGR